MIAKRVPCRIVTSCVVILLALSAGTTMAHVADGFTQVKSGLLAMEPRRTNIDPPSPDFRVFLQREHFFEMGYPDNWLIHESDDGYGVTIAPEGGFVETAGASELVYGVIVDRYDPFAEGTGDRFGYSSGPVESDASLARSTDGLLGRILQTNPYLQMVRNSKRSERVDGALSFSAVLSGRSPVTRQEERVTVFTRELSDGHVIYALFIAPGQDYDGLHETFNRMIFSLRVSDQTP